MQIGKHKKSENDKLHLNALAPGSVESNPDIIEFCATGCSGHSRI
jgi:hypothetical protein